MLIRSFGGVFVRKEENHINMNASTAGNSELILVSGVIDHLRNWVIAPKTLNSLVNDENTVQGG